MRTHITSKSREPKLRPLMESLRSRIVSGQLPPGTRLPTRSELAKEFGVATSTIQLITDQLRRAGFLETRVPAGTFVAIHPPHLCRFALIEPYDPGELGPGFYWQALAASARQIDADPTPRRFVIADDIDGHADREQYQMLVADMAQHRLAGLIFSQNPYPLADTPLLTEPGIPRVAFSRVDYPGVQAIERNGRAFLARAVEHLVSRQRRRLAIVAGYCTTAADVCPADVDQILARHRLSIPPYWRLSLHPRLPEGARGNTHLLFKGTDGRKPDGVIVLDDHLVDVVLGGMIDAGLRAPTDVEVVAMANFPDSRPTVMPVRRLGYDTRAMLAQAIASIEAQRRGEPTSALTQFDPVFEDELPRLAPPHARAER